MSTKNHTPLDNVDGLIITLSVMRKGTGHDISHYLEEKHIQDVGQLTNIATKAAELLWDTHDIKSV